MIVGALMTALIMSAPAADVLSAGERERLAVVIVPPLGHRAADQRVAAFLSAADDAFRARTMLMIDLAARLPFEAIDRCRAAGGFLCWVLASRELDPAKKGPRSLLLLSLARDENGRDRLSAALLDAARALAIHDAAPKAAAGWRDAVEDAIYLEAVLGESAFREASDADELRVYFGKLVTQDLRAALEKTGRWSAPGSIRVVAEQESTAGGPRAPALGATLSLDEARREIGLVEERNTTIAEVRPGDRVVNLTKPDCVPATKSARVSPGSVVEVHLLLSCPARAEVAAVVAEDEPGLWSSPWLYAGAAVAALLAGGIAVAATLPEERTVYQLRF